MFFLTEAIATSGMTVFPPFKMGVTSTSSHWMGTYFEHKHGFRPGVRSVLYVGSSVDVFHGVANFRTNTWVDRHVMARSRLERCSPSPGIKVTVYLPYTTGSISFSALLGGEEKCGTYVRAFLTSEGGSWCGGSITTEGLRPR